MMKTFLFFLLASALVAEPKYVPPREDTPLIRRDELPLDVASLGLVSKQLGTLAADKALSSPQDYRAAAQLLALALRLNPANTSAARTNSALAEGKKPAPTSEKARAAAAAYLWQTGEWLLLNEENPEARKLGQFIIAPLSQLDPAHALPEKAKPAGQDWLGAIASLQDFGATEPTPDEPEKKPEKPTGFFRKTAASRPQPAVGTYAMLQRIEKKYGPTIIKGKPNPRNNYSAPGSVYPLSLQIVDKDKLPDPYRKKITPGDPQAFGYFPRGEIPAESLFILQHPVSLGVAATLESRLRAFFQTRGTTLPEDKLYLVNTSGRSQSSKAILQSQSRRRGRGLSLPEENLPNLVAPIALMLDACISRQNPKENTVLLANLNPDGTLGTPDRCWILLTEITEHQPGLRVVLPASAEPLLSAYLPLDMPGKLLETEFILANTYEEARPFLFEGENEPAGIAKARGIWQEVRDKQPDGMATAKYLTLSGVHAKLAEALKASPRNISAKQLYQFGGENKPTRLKTKVTAMLLFKLIG